MSEKQSKTNTFNEQVIASRASFLDIRLIDIEQERELSDQISLSLSFLKY